jgi:molecular chaperone DnaK
MTASAKLGEKVYADMQAKQAAEGGGMGGAPGAGAEGAAGADAASAKPAGDDNVVDAEVKEVKKG